MKIYSSQLMLVRGLFAVIVAMAFSARSYGQYSAWQDVFAANHHWEAIACSADGSKLVASSGDYIFTSADSGVTWTQRASAGNHGWHAVASSADGTKLIAVAAPGVTPGGVFTSADSGATWTQTPEYTNVLWTSAASSADGRILTAAAYGTSIDMSRDSGATWLGANITTVNWTSLASSADGKTLIAAADNGYVYTTTATNAGPYWAATSFGSDKAWYVAISSNGACMAAAGSGSIYLSHDYGATWRLGPGTGGNTWSGIASSWDGTKLVAASSVQRIFVSADSGATWTETAATNLNWQGVACSADGQKSAAVSVSPSGIWLSRYTLPPYPIMGASLMLTNGAATRLVSPAAGNLIVGHTYQLQVTTNFNSWNNFGDVFSPTGAVWTATNHWNVASTNRLFFRLQMF